MGKLAIAVAVLCACAPPPPTGYVFQGGPGYHAQPIDPNSRRTVGIVGALLSPAKHNRTNWDGLPGSSTAAAAAALEEVLEAASSTTGEPALAVAAVLAGPAVHSLDAPDSEGRAELYVHGRLVGKLKLPKRQNEFAPHWMEPPIEWRNVDIRYARIRIVLADQDVGNPDPIGTVDIDSAALLQAASSPGGRFAFRAAEQTYNQILFVDVAVH